MSVLAKRGTQSSLNALVTANGLIASEILYATDTKKFFGATGIGAVTPLGSGTWAQIGSTQTASSKNTITFSSLSAYNEFYIETSGVVIGTPGGGADPDGYYLGIGTSINSGGSYQNEDVSSFGSPVNSIASNSNSGTLDDIQSYIRPLAPQFASYDGLYRDTGASAPYYYSAAVLKTGGVITNLRLKSGYQDGTLNTFVPQNMTAGTIKLFER